MKYPTWLPKKSMSIPHSQVDTLKLLAIQKGTTSLNNVPTWEAKLESAADVLRGAPSVQVGSFVALRGTGV